MSRRVQNLQQGINKAKKFKQMRLKGMSFGEISKEVGISRQGVQQFLKRYEDRDLIGKVNEPIDTGPKIKEATGNLVQ